MPPAVPSACQSDRVEQIRTALQDQLGIRRYQHWFGASTRLELSNGELIVHVASPYLVKWIQRQFDAVIHGVVASTVGPAVRVRYEVGGEVQLSPTPAADGTPAVVQVSVARRTSEPSTVPRAANKGRRKSSLADFVAGESNALALTAVHRVIEEPGSVSPLYLHGSVGTGKTHLLEALRGRLRKEHPQLQTLSLTGEQFGNYFTQALDARSLPSFRAKFRGVDVLLLDDVDFFDGKKGFEEEFLHTVKQFEAPGRQIVVTAHRHPRLLGRMSEELVSRFLAGLVCRLEAPDDSMRKEIVSRHAERQRVKFSEDAVEHVANRFTTNVRELEGAVNLLATWSQMTKRRVTVQDARRLLGRLERDCLRIVRLADVEGAVCEFFGLEAEALRSASRKQAVAQPRMLAMYLARQLTKTPYSEIGAYFGGRNHSTVMSAERKVAEQLTSDQSLQVAADEWSMHDIVRTLHDRIKAG